MNLSIMYGMLNYLMTNEKVSAQEIANTFEINQRTVYRYVEHLSMQGIPIDTQIGRNGGIFIDKKFKLERALLSQNEIDLLQNLLKKENSQTAKKLANKLNLF